MDCRELFGTLHASLMMHAALTLHVALVLFEMKEVSMESFATLAMLVLVVPVSGGIVAATPYLIPKRECFAVTVPESAHADEQIKALKRGYARTMAVLTVALTIVAAVAAVRTASTGYTDASTNALAVVVVFASLVTVAASFVLMLRNRRKVMAIKRERGWRASRQQAAALVAEDDIPGPISLAWNLLYVPVVLFVAALGVMWYPLMPDMIPMHADFAGNVNSWSPKGPGTLLFPLGVAAFVAVAFILCHVVMLKSKRPAHPGAPVTSALAYGLFARAQSIFFLAMGLLLSLVMGVTFMASSAGFITLGGTALLITLVCILLIVGSIVISVVYGQAGSRLFKRLETEDARDSSILLLDDDEHWKLGVFYFNPDDASLWLPERFGIGWTMNLARPAAWAFVGGFALILVLFIVGIAALV